MNENHTFNSTCRALIIGASGGIGSALPEAINTAYGITD
ncbi:MAG: C factor, cell signaling protein, partial [Rhodobacterales bacterium]|nr:C factor, cell signaling protein [Rhodobacterales bacterium]